MDSKELLVPSPLLENSDIDKYIWISDSFLEHRNAQRLFDWMLKNHIYVRGFATDKESMISLKMYNKKIYDIDMLEQKKTLVFYDFYFEGLDVDLDNRMLHKARVITPDIGKEDVVIWGRGRMRECVYKILTGYGVQIKCFVECEKKLADESKYGLPVYSPEQLDEMESDVTIIEALENWEELDRELQKRYERRFHYTEGYDEINKAVTYRDEGEEKELFCLSAFWMFNHFVGKKLYIYGIGNAEKEFQKYLKLLDFEVEGFLIDETAIQETVGMEVPVKYVEEILYEDEWYIWAYDRRRAERLRELGFIYFKDYYVKDYRFDTTIDQRTILDINLGHSYVADTKYPGFMVYGDEREDDLKIVVLGGSTTDGTMYPFKSWSQLLYEEMGEKGVTIYNGGVCSYTSGQELFKLIRDVFQLNPNIVITYDGYNELAFTTCVQYPFAFLYLEKVFRYAEDHIEDSSSVSFGNAAGCGWFENWLNNIRSMYALANERNIQFFSFCQPVLISKKKKAIREKNILLSMLGTTEELFTKESFREHMCQMNDKPAYMYDLSHIFDDEDDVYMDVCHVWEKGNRIIAREIKKVILPCVHKLMAERSMEE